MNTEKIYQNKDLMLHIAGKFITMWGSLLQSFGFSLFILDTTGSSVKFATVLTICGIIGFFITPVAGVIADWFNKKKIIVGLDLLSGLTLLGILVYSNIFELNFSSICITVALLTIFSAIDTPVSDSFLPLLAGENNIVQANSANNVLSTVARIFAPIIGGILYSFIGINMLIIFSLVTYILCALMEMMINYNKINPTEKLEWISSFRQDFTQGFRFIVKQKTILLLLIYGMIANLLILPIGTIGFPYIVNVTFGLPSIFYGISEGSLSLGILVGGILTGICLSKKEVNLVKAFMLTVIGSGFFVVAIGISVLLYERNILNTFTSYCIMIFFIFLIGAIFTTINIALPSYIQKNTPPNMMGRVMSIRTMLLMSTGPIGQIILGFLLNYFYSHNIFIVAALILIVIGFIAFLFIMRNINKEAGDNLNG